LTKILEDVSSCGDHKFLVISYDVDEW